MANGFRLGLLEHIKQVTNEANPMYKVQPTGFLNMLLTTGNPNSVRFDNAQGHKNTIKVKYRPRFTVAQTDTSKSCDQVLTPAYSEATVSLSSTRQLAVYLGDETVAQYEDEASRTVMVGQPATDRMNGEVLDSVFSAANALLQGVTTDLLGQITWGKNRITGLSTAQAINFPQTITAQPVNNGIGKVLSDYQRNFLTGRPQIVGSGIFHQWMATQFYKGLDTGGVNTSIATTAFDYHMDEQFNTTIGADKFAAFEPGSINIVQYMEYTAWKAGDKPGASTFGIITLPVQTAVGIVPVMFDFQLKYLECPTSLTDAYSGSTTTYEKGYVMILSKQCGLFQIPADAFRHEDDARSVNGALLFTATNS